MSFDEIVQTAVQLKYTSSSLVLTDCIAAAAYAVCSTAWYYVGGGAAHAPEAGQCSHRMAHEALHRAKLPRYVPEDRLGLKLVMQIVVPG